MFQTDERLKQRLDTAIEQSPYLVGKRLRLETTEGRVVLKGTVQTFFQKQMAQEALRRVDGVEHIQNDLEVTPWDSPLLQPERVGER